MYSNTMVDKISNKWIKTFSAFPTFQFEFSDFSALLKFIHSKGNSIGSTSPDYELLAWTLSSFEYLSACQSRFIGVRPLFHYSPFRFSHWVLCRRTSLTCFNASTWFFPWTRKRLHLYRRNTTFHRTLTKPNLYLVLLVLRLPNWIFAGNSWPSVY